MICSSGKESFNSKDEAVIFNKGYGKRKDIYHNPYWCLECGKWHLTSRKTGAKRKKRIAR